MDTSKNVQVGETSSGAHSRPGCARLHGPVGLFFFKCIYSESQIGYPRTYARREAPVRNTFSESTSGVRTTAMPTDGSQGFEPNSTE